MLIPVGSLIHALEEYFTYAMGDDAWQFEKVISGLGDTNSDADRVSYLDGCTKNEFVTKALMSMQEKPEELKELEKIEDLERLESLEI